MVKCPLLRDEYLGQDSCYVCRRQIGKQIGFQCPRKQKRYVLHTSCFNLNTLMHLTVAETEAIIRPGIPAPAGTGQPTEMMPRV